MLDLSHFEQIARRARQFSETRERSRAFEHPFNERNIVQLPETVQKLFDNGHYSQSTFEAYKFVDKEIQRHSKSKKSGFNLMMDVFAGDNPIIRLTPMIDTSQQDEQKGFQFLFAGATQAIRNPRGHEYTITDDPDLCLDHLCLASLLIRRLAEAGYK